MSKKLIDLLWRQKTIWQFQYALDCMANNAGDDYSHILQVEIDGPYGSCANKSFVCCSDNQDRRKTLKEAIDEVELSLRCLSVFGGGLLGYKNIEEYLRSHQVIRIKNSNRRWNNYYICLNKNRVKQFRVYRLLFLLKQKLNYRDPFESL